MKKLLKSLVLFAATAMALTSCENEAMNEGIETNDTYTLNFVAGAPESKTSVSINGNAANFAWGENEEFVFVQNTEGETALTLGTDVTYTNNNGLAEISATFTGDAETEYNHVAVYPAIAWADNNDNYNKAKLLVKNAQTLVEGSFDPTADLMVSEAITCTASDFPNTLRFTRLVSIAEMNLKGLAVAEGEKILSVVFSVSESSPALTGRNHVDLSTSLVSEYAYYGESNTITLTSADGIDSSSESTKVYFTCNPATIASGATYTITVTTDVAKYTKSATLSKDLVLEIGKVKAFGVNMADATRENAIDFSGQYIIVAKESGNYFFMSTWKEGQSTITDGNNRTAVDSGVAEITDFNSSVTNFGSIDGKYIWTLSAATTGGYTIANSDETAWFYLASNNNRGNMTTTKNSAGVFTIDKNSTTNVFTIIDNTYKRTLSYNEASACFACYESGQQPELYLIPYVEDTRTAQTLSFAEETYTYDLAGDTAFEAPTVQDAMTTVTYTSSNESVATVDANTGEVTINTTGTTGTTTITATAVATDTYKEGSASYTLTVTNSASGDSGEEDGEEASPVTITLDCTSQPFTTNLPIAKGTYAEATYTDNAGYVWTLCGTSATGYYYNSSKYLMIGKTGSYIGMPVVEGQKLSSVELYCRSGASTNVKYEICDTDNTVVSGGTAQNGVCNNTTPVTWNLSDTQESTQYRIRITTNYNGQITKIVLKYN